MCILFTALCKQFEISMFLILGKFPPTIFCPYRPLSAQPTTFNFGHIFTNNFKAAAVLTEPPVYLEKKKFISAYFNIFYHFWYTRNMRGTVVKHAVALSIFSRMAIIFFSLVFHPLDEYIQVWHAIQSATYLHNISQPRASFTTCTKWCTPPMPVWPYASACRKLIILISGF